MREHDDMSKVVVASRSLLLAFLLMASCKSAEKQPTPPTASGPAIPTTAPPSSAGVAARASASAAVQTMVDGAKFMPAFPAVGLDGTNAKQDRPTKEGFAEVVYKKGSDDVATITITDTSAVAAVRDDYRGATERVGESPLKTSGNFKSAMLVADRFQVQIQSQRLKAPQRKAWLEKVDSRTLAALK